MRGVGMHVSAVGEKWGGRQENPAIRVNFYKDYISGYIMVEKYLQLKILNFHHWRHSFFSLICMAKNFCSK